MTIKPNTELKYATPDTVAECWNGVFSSPSKLYEALWNLVPLYDRIDIEECGPADVVGVNSVASFWSHLSTEHQIELNKLAEIRAAELAEWMA